MNTHFESALEVKKIQEDSGNKDRGSPDLATKGAVTSRPFLLFAPFFRRHLLQVNALS